MDSKGVYRAPALKGAGKEQGNESEPEQEPRVEQVEATEQIEEEIEETSAEIEPVADEDIKKSATEAEADSELASEPIVTINDGKVRVVTNYPLAAMVCFAVVVLLICAVLVGWRIGHDSALKKVSQAQKQAGQEIQDENAEEASEFWNQ